MKITIKLAGIFRINRFKEEVREYPGVTSVQNLVEDLQIPDFMIGIILINGLHAKREDLLHEGDTVCLLPLLDGG